MVVVDVGDTNSYVPVAQLWHTDGSYRQVPAYVTLLRALEISPVGGETCFANTAAGYDELPKAIKVKIAGFEAIHDLENTRSMIKGYRPFTAESARRFRPPNVRWSRFMRIPAENTSMLPIMRATSSACHAKIALR